MIEKHISRQTSCIILEILGATFWIYQLFSEIIFIVNYILNYMIVHVFFNLGLIYRHVLIKFVNGKV